MGLATLVRFFLLVFLSTYVAAGQFAVHLAASHLQAQLDEIALENTSVARHAALRFDTHDFDHASLPEVRGMTSSVGEPGLQMAVFLNGQPVEVDGLVGHAKTPLGAAGWLEHRPAKFRGIVQDESQVYLATADRMVLRDGRKLTVIGSVPLNRERLQMAAEHLGRVDLLPGLEVRPQHTPSRAELRQARISGGSAPPAVNLLDYKVRFFSTLPVQDWETGATRGVPLNVESRPSLLYDQLFAAALTGRNTDVVSFVFLSVCLFFALLEAFALYMAVRLSRTITQSVEDLYDATISIDGGDLSHRIQVSRTDQLAELCRSFNRMSWSMGRLIEQQKEKERIESELSIAQEVQANLFPKQNLRLPELELHGICRPARIVSGDYYDFLTFNAPEAVRGDGQQTISGLGIALGDISGKGISAALLMATLHSAVRAYRFASEELLTPVIMRGAREDCVEYSELFGSPGRVLALLNRHLYRSTTPEKYATLFLAHYERETAQLTYSNAGQLPPFVLRSDDSLVRLDRGGTVVGLMDGMTYEQEALQMETGDILIAYSDGVTEPENDFGDFGEARLIDVVRQFRHEPLDIISSEVMRALDAWIGEGEQPDDITLVLARQV